MRIAITGGSGNLGSAVMRRLARCEDGDLAPFLLGLSRRAPSGVPIADGASPTWLPTDISEPGAERLLRDAFAGYDAVIHLAWQLQPGHDLERLHAVNVDGSRRVVQAAVDAGVPHVVVASSVGAYSPGPKHRTVDESWPTRGVPGSSYSGHKVALEAILDEIEAGHPDVVITRLRPALVFQARAGQEITGLFLGPFFPAGLAGRVRLPALPLPRRLTFQAVHADDVAEAVAVALKARPRGGLNVAADAMLTPDDLAEALGAHRSLPLPLPVLRAAAALTWHARVQPTEPGWIDLAANVPWMSTERLRGLGWRPTHTSVEALLEMVRGIRQKSNAPEYPPLAGLER